jgi:AraC-like DNA-binding protein
MPKDGTVAILHALGSNLVESGQIRRMESVAREIRRSHLGAALALWLQNVPTEHALGGFHVLSASGLRLWLTETPTEATLRQAARVSGLRLPDVASWLTLRIRPKGPVELGLTHVMAGALVGHVLDPDAAREATRWARRLGLPGAGAWKTMGCLLRGLICLQSEPSISVAQAARQAGFADGPTFSHACRRMLDTTPSDARRRVGWEWLLMRFLA